MQIKYSTNYIINYLDADFTNIINDIEKYVKNLGKYHIRDFHIDNNLNKVPEFVSENEISGVLGADLDAVSGKKNEYKKSLREALTEVDLFGNIVVQKEDWESSATLDEMNSMVCNCQKCTLGQTRTRFVFGVGNPKADVVLVGEAPGADEDAKGEPFVGRAGQLLNKILEASGFKREEVYICNILKCRPPGNRNPMPDEIEKCEPYLKMQLQLIKPKLILALGKFAADTLLNLRQPLTKMRGNIHMYNGIKTMVTFHPAALLRNPQWKRPTWEDMKQFRKLYDELKKK